MRTRVLALVFSAFVVASCAGSGQDGDAVTASNGSSTTTLPPLLEAPANVVSVDRLVDERHVTVSVADVPSGPAPSCDTVIVDRTESTIVNTSEAVRVQVVLERADGLPFPRDGYGTWEGCDLETRPFDITLSAPLSGRPVTISEPGYSLWTARPDGGFTRCALPECDPMTGSAPDPCGHELVEAARAQDVPAHSDLNIRGCDGMHAVVDIDFGSGACPQTDGGPNPCAGQRIDRTFFVRTDERWTLLTYGSRHSPGCADAQLPPDFPRDLCAALPAAVPEANS